MSNITLSMSKFTVVGTSEWPITATEHMFAELSAVSH